MNKYLLIALTLFGLSSCKVKQMVVKPEVVKGPKIIPADLEKRNFLLKADSSDISFQTFEAQGKADISINGNRHSAGIDLRIKKDQIIWAYINVSILPVAQAYITPDSIKIINILQGKYIHKSFDFIRQYSSSAVDFKTLQAILTGNKPNNFIAENEVYKVLGLLGYELSGEKDSLQVKLKFNPLFKASGLELLNVSKNQNLEVNYNDFSMLGNKTMPRSIAISSKVKSNDLNLTLSYRKVKLNEPLDFPFNAPAGN